MPEGFVGSGVRDLSRVRGPVEDVGRVTNRDLHHGAALTCVTRRLHDPFEGPICINHGLTNPRRRLEYFRLYLLIRPRTPIDNRRAHIAHSGLFLDLENPLVPRELPAVGGGQGRHELCKGGPPDGL